MITRLLVANRGEIARRIFRTCRELGIGTVAVFSDPDRDLPHAAEADLAVRLAGAAPADTYLNIEAILNAARAAGADAVHPGYGFLSENAGFAQAVIDAGLTWVGPPPAAISAMGSKISAKKLMKDAGVPIMEATEGEFPVLVKASAGGGGRGMRIVRDAEELPKALAAARREAESAFGDGTVFCEPLLENARHIEVQVLADEHGTVWTLGERECSIQRRHQKVIEEAPSPAVDQHLRARLCEAATNAARAIGYTGAGTVEFMLAPVSPPWLRPAAPDGRFFFLEVNTRLQVEHPVTECIYGVDLVRLQLEVAEGAALTGPPTPNGHAIEARLYAEDPAEGYRPESGRLHRFEVPGDIRLDSGVESGSDIGVHYDPMLAKVIAYAPTRTAAARKLATALAGARIHGLVTNRDQLVNVLRHPEFLAGATDTGFLDRFDLTATLADPEAVRISALAAALADAATNRATAKVLRGLPSGWRNVTSAPQTKLFEGIKVNYMLPNDSVGSFAEEYSNTAVAGSAPEEVLLDSAGVRLRFAVARHGNKVYVDSSLGPVTLTPLDRLPDPAEQVVPGSLLAPMPGTVIRVEATEGDTVGKGAPIVVLEAMKMEHQILAPTAGVLSELNAVPGTQVDNGTLLAVITPNLTPMATPRHPPDTQER